VRTPGGIKFSLPLPEGGDGGALKRARILQKKAELFGGFRVGRCFSKKKKKNTKKKIFFFSCTKTRRGYLLSFFLFFHPFFPSVFWFLVCEGEGEGGEGDNPSGGGNRLYAKSGGLLGGEKKQIRGFSLFAFFFL